MSIISSLIVFIGALAVNITLALGYPGVVFLMALESTAVPLPSELILPFAGYLAAIGQLNFCLIIIASAVGSLLGSLISYAMGYYGGNKLILKLGRYLLLDETDLLRSGQWFNKKGEATIFVARFIPVVRHLISIPAGIAKMDLKKFCLYTIIGATIWNTLITYLGFLLGQNWRLIRHYTEPLSIIVAVLLAIAGFLFVARHLHRKK